LKYDYDKTVLTSLAEYYLQASQKDKWDITFDRLIALDPSSTEYLIQKGLCIIQCKTIQRLRSFLKRLLKFPPAIQGFGKAW